MKLRALLTIIVGGLAAFFLQREQARGTFTELDRGHVAWLLANREQAQIKSPSVRVIFARIEPQEFDDWPPPPVVWSGLLDELITLKPGAVVLNSLDGWAAETIDPLLAKSCQACPGLLLGTRAEAQGPVQETILPVLLDVHGDRTAVPSFAFVIGEKLLSPLGKLAFSQVDLSEHPFAKATLKDGVFRLPLLFRQGERIIPSLTLQALLQHARIPVEQVKVRLGQAIIIPGQLEVPIDAAGGFSLQFLAVNETTLTSFKLDALLLDAQKRDSFFGQNDPIRTALPQVADALVWVGEDHREARRFHLPNGQDASLTELTARAFVAMQSGRNVVLQPVTGQWLTLAGVLCYGLWLACLSRARLWKWTIFGVILLGLVSLLTFQSATLWMPVGPGLVLLGILWIVNLVVHPHKIA
jgi:hypothetical protein